MYTPGSMRNRPCLKRTRQRAVEKYSQCWPVSATITHRYIVHALTFMFTHTHTHTLMRTRAHTHTHTLHHPVPSLQINSHKIDSKVLSVLAGRACSISSRRKWLVLLRTYKQNKSKGRSLCCIATVQNVPEFPVSNNEGIRALKIVINPFFF